MSLRPHLVGLFVAVHLILVVVGNVPKLDTTGYVKQAARAYGNYLGPKQGWSMFGGVRANTVRLCVSVKRNGAWEPVFVQGSRAYQWEGRRFNHYRWREAFLMLSGKSRERARRTMARWVGRLALEAHPDATSAKVYMERADLLTPAELRAGKEKVFDEVVWSVGVGR